MKGFDVPTITHPHPDSTISRPWTPLYNEAYLEIAQAEHPSDIRVMLALLHHANRYGLCRPGLKRLSYLCKLPPDIIKTSLRRMIRNHWVKIITLPDELGVPQPHVQISPLLLRVRDNDRERVMFLWVSGRPMLGNGAALAQPEQPAEAVKAEVPERPEQRVQMDAEQPENNSARPLKSKNSYNMHKSDPPNAYGLRREEEQNQYSALRQPTLQEDQLAKNIAAEFSQNSDYQSTYTQMLGYIKDYGFKTVSEQYAEIRRRRAENQKIRNPAGLLVILIRATKNDKPF